MNINEATVEITRHGKVLSSVSVVMPTWDKVEENGSINVSMPLFGINTYAKNDEDAEIAVEEAIKAFCIASERYGHGFEEELKSLGWKPQSEKAAVEGHTLLSIESDNDLINQIMQTGEPVAHINLAIA